MRQSLLSQYASRNSFMIKKKKKKKMIISLTKVWKPPRQDIGYFKYWRIFLNWGSILLYATCWQIFHLHQQKTALAFVEYTLFLIYVTESCLR